MSTQKRKSSAKLNILRAIIIVAFIAVLAVVFVALGFNGKDGEDESTTSEIVTSTSTDISTQAPTAKESDKSEESTTKTERSSERETGSVTESTSAAEQSTASKTTAISTTAAAKSSTVKSSSSSSSGGIPEASAYAYAGFNPVVTDMSGEWNLILINKHYCLPAGYTPNLSPCISGSDIDLDSRVSPHYQEMYNAAAKEGIYLTPVSGYRSVNRQKINFENKINYYMNQGYGKTEATKKASMIIFLPGASEHNAGLAMDIISLDTDFDQTKAYRWLCDNAADYGFILRYAKDKTDITECTYEPWHWRYVGVKAAKEMKASGQCLEEYLGMVS